MEKPTYQDFIGVYKEAVNPDLCDWLVNYMDNSHYLTNRSIPNIKDQQICLEAFSPGEANMLMDHVNGCLLYYTQEYPYLSSFNYVSSITLLQKTSPTGGYHVFHGENVNWDTSSRTLAWMVYLNDVEDGGETEFLYQKIKVKPQKGKVVIWPGGFTHLHRGNPPGSAKYIATGWYQCDQGLRHVVTSGIQIPPSDPEE